MSLQNGVCRLHSAGLPNFWGRMDGRMHARAHTMRAPQCVTYDGQQNRPSYCAASPGAWVNVKMKELSKNISQGRQTEDRAAAVSFKGAQQMTMPH